MSYYALVDCNNFYVSCERIFCPHLEGQPVIILSNNDGCVVARSEEAKHLGIAMGEPFFKVKNLCLHRNVFVFSSNYQLYGSISQRIMNALALFTPDLEVYSIDEAFLKFPPTMTLKDLEEQCSQIRSNLKKWTGIPVSIGIAQTKTLAKAASKIAKKETQRGIFSLVLPEIIERSLKDLSTGDIWGLGHQLQRRLKSQNIHTAWEFREMEPSAIRRNMGILGERILWELRGLSCNSLVKVPSAKQSITCSRSFGAAQTELAPILEAISTHAASACRKLRAEKSCTGTIHVTLEALTDSEAGTRQYYGTSAAFSAATSDTPAVIKMAKHLLTKLFRPHQRYKKCGITLLDLVPEQNCALDLFLAQPDPKRQRLAHTIDALNNRLGKDTVFYGAMGIRPQWKMKSEKCSPHYTTCWKELLVVC